MRLTANGKAQAPAIVAAREASARPAREPAVRRENTVPVPEALIGKRAVGIVSKTGSRNKFSFIEMKDGCVTAADGKVMAPRIYFSFSSVQGVNRGDTYWPQSGLEVEFTCMLDAERNSPFASDVQLTAAGRAEAEARAEDKANGKPAHSTHSRC